MYEAIPLGTDFKRLLLLHPDCVIDGVVDTSKFSGILERNSDGSNSCEKIIGFLFNNMSQFTVVHVKELKMLLDADNNDGEGLIAVNLKELEPRILCFLNLRYDMNVLINKRYRNFFNEG